MSAAGSQTLPERMRAFVLVGHGGPDQLQWHEDWPVPLPGPREALIEVAACGLNNTDINTRTGWYSPSVTGATVAAVAEDAATDSNSSGAWGDSPLQFPRIQGADVCGTVVAVGSEAPRSLVGKRVLIDTWLRDWSDPTNRQKYGYFGSECDGGFADYCTVDARQVHAISSRFSDAELATFATSSITAENMLQRAAVTEGDTVLITGASGGVGTALIQLARRRGARIVAQCSAAKAGQVRSLGAETVLPRQVEHLPAALEAALGRPQVDVVADVVGGPAWPRLIEALVRGGRYTCSGAIAGPMVDFDLRTFYLNDLTFTGATAALPGLFEQLVGCIERGEMQPQLAATYPLRDLHRAQEDFLAKAHTGNLVVTHSEDAGRRP